jgi:3-keto-disaccharide hydrolase
MPTIRNLMHLLHSPTSFAITSLLWLGAQVFWLPSTMAQDEDPGGETAPVAAAPADEPDSVAGQDEPVDEPPFTAMIDEKWASRWKWFSSAPDVPLNTVWKVLNDPESAETILECSGQPKGFLFTNAVWSEFEMQLQWRYPKDVDGNSGILVFVQDESRVWPTSMQVQLHQPKAGSVFPSGDAKSDNTTDADLAKPTGEWNDCRIVSRGGTLSVEINGKKAGEITGVTPNTGKIALQSEGSQVQFRRLKIRSLLPPADKAESPAAKVKPPADKGP